jgi:hypothetical protein
MTQDEMTTEIMQIMERVSKDAKLVYETFKIQGEKEQLSEEDANDLAETMKSAYIDWLYEYHRVRLFAKD